MSEYTPGVFWHCFVASLGDGIMVLLIVAAGAVVLRRRNWFFRPGVAGYGVMLTTGLLLAMMVEWAAMYVLRRWEYTGMMPKLAVLEIGLVPLAQMLVLPPVIFRIVQLITRRRN